MQLVEGAAAAMLSGSNGLGRVGLKASWVMGFGFPEPILVDAPVSPSNLIQLDIHRSLAGRLADGNHPTPLGSEFTIRCSRTDPKHRGMEMLQPGS